MANEREETSRAADNATATAAAENDYGLKDLAHLPLLEQVHRLFHAIQQKYPYKETDAWKSLPLDQKKKMLAYIREKRSRKPKPPRTSLASNSEAPASTANGVDAASDSKTKEEETAMDPALTVKVDPYLQMLQRRNLRTSETSAGAVGDEGGVLMHPNSAYVAPAQVAHYAETKKKFKARWQVAEAEFYEHEKCACGVAHDSERGGKKAALLLQTISSMMSTFGDSTRSCVAAVEEVRELVGEYVRSVLSSVDADAVGSSTCLRALVGIFQEEAIYYGRWREFRGETKHEQNELEDVEEEELAEELDLFAVAETDSVFNETFLERIRFADERTKTMDWSNYDMFAKGRKLNFMNNKAQQFRQWLGLGKWSRASLEFLNFVAYHNIGRLVELAIKNRTGGQLKQLETPLLKDDIESVSASFLPAERLPGLIDRSQPPPTKTRRVGPSSASSRSARMEATTSTASTSSTTAVAAPTETGAGADTPETGSRAGIQPAITSSGVTARPTRLKRLR